MLVEVDSVRRVFAEEGGHGLSALLEKLNHRPFRKREGSRASLFAELDWPALQPLPAERYILAHWKTVRVTTSKWTVTITAFPTNWPPKTGSSLHRGRSGDFPW